MKAVKVFKTVQMSHFSLGQHVAFMRRIYDELVALLDRAEKLHVSDALMEEFNAFIGLESDLAKEAKRLLNTSARSDTDQERDDVVSYLLQEIRNAARSPVAAKKRAGESLGPLAEAYAGIQGEAMDMETASIRGLIIDLKKSGNAPHVTALGLDEVVAKLEEINERYDRERKELSAKNRADKKANSREVRPQTDAVLRRILDLIYASELLAVEGEAVDQAYIEEEIDIINEIIDEYRASFNKSQAQKKSPKKEDGGLKPEPADKPE